MGFVPRMTVFYAALFASIGIQMPFLPLWLAAKGLDQQTIGLLFASAALMRMLAIPVATRATAPAAAIAARTASSCVAPGRAQIQTSMRTLTARAPPAR